MNQFPDFMIIGTARGGTTSMYEYLKQHPQIYDVPKKEILYFMNRCYGRGIDWYKKYFTPDNSLLNFDSSVAYLYEPEPPERIKKILPNCKFIVLLRNPVDRLLSVWYKYWRVGAGKNSSVSWADIIKAFSYVNGSTPEIYEPTNRGAIRAVGGAFYYRQLNRWFNCFPREQFLIIKSEDFYEHTPETLSSVFSFLGVRKCNKIDITPIDPLAQNGTGYGDIEIDKKMVADFYRPYNEQLYELLGRDFEW